MAQSAEPTQVVYVGWLPTGPEACRLAPGASTGQSEPFCTAAWLNEEPDRGQPCGRFREGMRHNECMAEIMWHRRETRRQTENTTVMPGALEGRILLDTNSCGFTRVVLQESSEPFMTLHGTLTRRVWADRRKKPHMALALMRPLVMKRLHVVGQRMAE